MNNPEQSAAKHCRFEPQGCHGIGNCLCDCDDCLWADDVAGVPALDRDERDDSPAVDAAGNCYSDADPGL